MKKLLLLPALLFLHITLFAQEGLFLYQYKKAPGDVFTVIADTAYVRDQPSTKGAVVRQLSAGAKVTLVESAGVQTIRGFEAPWIKVRMPDAKEAYIWKGLLALDSYTRNGETFLYGIDRSIPGREDGDGATYFAKATVLDSAGNALASKKWKLSSSEALSACEGKVLGDMGLDGIKSIFRIYFSGEACGIPTDYYYFGWTGTELLTLPGKTMVSDAGVFYYEEKLFFPSETGGQPGKIVKVTEREEVLEETDKQGNPKTKTSRSREVYRWDGKVSVKE